jgi:hypothetical protein
VLNIINHLELHQLFNKNEQLLTSSNGHSFRTFLEICVCHLFKVKKVTE